MFAATAIIPYDIRHKHRLTKFVTHCWHRKPFPSANRSVLSTRWQAHKPRPFRELKRLSHSSKKTPFPFFDRSIVRTRTIEERVSAGSPVLASYYQRRSNYLVSRAAFLRSFCPFDCPRVPRSSRNIIDTIGICRFQRDGFLELLS